VQEELQPLTKRILCHLIENGISLMFYASKDAPRSYIFCLHKTRRMNRIVTLFFILCLYCPFRSGAASIVLHTKNAVAWLPQQTIRGTLEGFRKKQVTVHQDSNTFIVAVAKGNSFQFSLLLHNDTNRIWVSVNDSGSIVSSDTVILQLGYRPMPVIKPYATVNTEAVVLHATTIANPWKKLQYCWTGDDRNPAPVQIRGMDDSVVRVQVPSLPGIYYFNLTVTSGKDIMRFQTYVTRTEGKLQAFNMDSSYADWINDAVIYEITPYSFVKNAKYDDITAKLPEIKSIGVNTLWLQPLFQCYDKGQGYEVTDYFSLRDDLGNEAQLQRLIQAAKSLGLRVLFDFVPNHTSIHHPYAEDCAAYGTESHYYNFYQHDINDGAMYSSQYHKDDKNFVYYFWDDLVNLNYANAEVRQWILEACKYWVKKFDLDGYRFDAVWGVNARQPDFGKLLQLELKVIKPDLLLLAEDKGAMTGTYAKGFDASYDWTADTGWVSHWSWQYDYTEANNLLIFSFPIASKRGPMLWKALFHNGDSTHLRLRFMENNDLPSFSLSQGLSRTKMAAALMFALPGIPLLYNGQEVGSIDYPSRKKPTFKRAQTIQSEDKNNLFPFYQKLAAIRAAHSCLRNGMMGNIDLSPATTMVAFHRSNAEEDIVTVINMDDASSNALLDLHTMIKGRTGTFELTDLITGKTFTYKEADVAGIAVPMDGYSTRILSINPIQKDWVILAERGK
jgi:glycosidase